MRQCQETEKMRETNVFKLWCFPQEFLKLLQTCSEHSSETQSCKGNTVVNFLFLLLAQARGLGYNIRSGANLCECIGARPDLERLLRARPGVEVEALGVTVAEIALVILRDFKVRRALRKYIFQVRRCIFLEMLRIMLPICQILEASFLDQSQIESCKRKRSGAGRYCEN